MEVRGLGMEVWKVEGPTHQETEEPQPTGSSYGKGLGREQQGVRSQNVKAVEHSWNLKLRISEMVHELNLLQLAMGYSPFSPPSYNNLNITKNGQLGCKSCN